MPKPTFVFVCVHNAGKSQMGAAIARGLMGDSAQVLSAGTHPGSALNAEAVATCLELGFSMEGESPKQLTAEILTAANRVIVIGDEAVVEPVAGMQGEIVNWLTIKPGPEAGDKLAQTRIVRDDILVRVKNLMQEFNL